MVRTFNYTGRERVYHNEIKLNVNWNDEICPTFTCNFEFDDEKYPSDARVYLEADRRESVTRMRFDYGTISDLYDTPQIVPSGLESNKLTKFNKHAKPRFQLKVIDENSSIGKIIGKCENIRLTNNSNNLDPNEGITILNFIEKDLGEEVWKLRLPNQDNDMPDFITNKEIPGIKRVFREEPWSMNLTLSAVVRMVLRNIVVERRLELDQTGEQWYSLWLRHMSKIAQKELPQLGAGGEIDEELREKWIDEAVSAFSKTHLLSTKLALFLQEIQYGGDQ